MKNYIQEGDVVTSIAPSGGVSSGKLYLIGSLIVLASVSVAENEEFEGVTKGVFEFSKTSANAPSQFDNAYWDAVNEEVTTVSTGNTLVGVFMESYSNGSTLAQVRLNGVSI